MQTAYFSQVTVAHTGLSEEESVNNIVAAVEKLKQSIPGGETNIRILHLRTLDSPALAIFASLGKFYIALKWNVAVNSNVQLLLCCSMLHHTQC